MRVLTSTEKNELLVMMLL